MHNYILDELREYMIDYGVPVALFGSSSASLLASCLKKRLKNPVSLSFVSFVVASDFVLVDDWVLVY